MLGGTQKRINCCCGGGGRGTHGKYYCRGHAQRHAHTKNKDTQKNDYVNDCGGWGTHEKSCGDTQKINGLLWGEGRSHEKLLWRGTTHEKNDCEGALKRKTNVGPKKNPIVGGMQKQYCVTRRKMWGVTQNKYKK